MAKVIQIDITVRTTFEVPDEGTITPEMIRYRLTFADMWRVVKTETRSEVHVDR